MTYSEFREQYKFYSDFEWAYGALSEEQARKLIKNENASVTVKACMMQTWRKCHDENEAIMANRKKRRTKKEELFMEQCEKYHEYPCIEDYISDIKKWLILSSWHYRESRAEEIIQENMHFIVEAYEKKEPVGDIAVDIGYACG